MKDVIKSTGRLLIIYAGPAIEIGAVNQENVMEKGLGKISYITLGDGGYQDIQFGVSVTLDTPIGSVMDFKGYWGLTIEVGKNTKWTEADRDAAFADVMRWLNQLMMESKVTSFNALKGKPVEVTFDGNKLHSWRILTEVL